MLMRVAMLGQYPLDETRNAGGVEAVMVPLLQSLARCDDLELHVVTCQPNAQERVTTTQSGLPLHVRKRRRLGRATWHVRDVSSIGRTLHSLSPDVVHAQGLGIYAAAAVRSPYPHVVTAHGIVFREAEFAVGLAPRWRGFMDSLFERYCLARVQNLIVINRYVEEDLLCPKSLPLRSPAAFRGRVYAIENPVDNTFFSVGAGEGAQRSEEGALLYAGRVIARKGLLNLLHALAEVREVMPQVHLRVAGETESDPAYFSKCSQLIAQQALATAVTFLGPLTVQQMAGEYARCAILALPSTQETAPVVVAEAMAVGRPVVATRVCGVPYMVEDGGSGLLVESGDVSGLARALLRLLGDNRLCAQMGQRGRELARTRFEVDVVAGKTRQVYLQLVNQE